MMILRYPVYKEVQFVMSTCVCNIEQNQVVR